MTKDTSDPTHGGRPPSRQLPPVAWAAPAPLKSVPPKLAPRRMPWLFWLLLAVIAVGLSALIWIGG